LIILAYPSSKCLQCNADVNMDSFHEGEPGAWCARFYCPCGRRWQQRIQDWTPSLRVWFYRTMALDPANSPRRDDDWPTGKPMPWERGE